MGVEQYQIEENVPLPPVTRGKGGGRDSRYPFAGMQPGHSFLVPYNADDPKKVARRVRTAILLYRKNHPSEKFHTRREDSGMRVWRASA
jgi:hypothetical protein